MHKFLIVLACVVPVTGQSGSFVVGRQSPDGQIAFHTYELFTANGRDSVRILAGSQSTIDERAYGSLPRMKLSQAGTLRRDRHLIVQLPSTPEGKPAIVLPDQLRFTAEQSIHELWAGVAFAGKPSRKDPAETVFHPQEFFALIPGTGAEAALSFVLNAENFASLEERLAAMRGLAASFPNDVELERLRTHMEDELMEWLQQFESGGPYSAVAEALKYAAGAEMAFPQAPRILETARALRERKAWVDATVLELQSLYNASRWDEFLEKYLPFEKYQASFLRLAHNRTRALRESARVHVQRGRDLAEGKSYTEAMQEFRLALRRDPSNRPLQDLVEEKRQEASLAMARKKGTHQALPKDSPQAGRLAQHLTSASRLTGEGKLTEAEQEIKAAAELDANAPQFLLVRAKLLNARSAWKQALAQLDAYDESVIDPAERRLGQEIRLEITSDQQKRKSGINTELTDLYAGGRYTEAFLLASKAVELDGEDPEFLYHSGLLAAVLRKNPTATEHLLRFLRASDAVGSDAKRRGISLRVLSILQAEQPGGRSGLANWFSGRKLPADVFYCPTSLAFQPKIAAVRADRQEQTFDWAQDGRLTAVLSNRNPGTYFFDYFDAAPQVSRIAQEKPAGVGGLGVVASKPDEGGIVIGLALPGSKPDPKIRYVTLPGTPMVNTQVLAVLELPATVGFAPNPYFDPFVWTGMHSFRFSYDKHGRLESAAEIGAARVARFAWSGERLQNIRVYATEGGAERQIYRRTMAYAAGKLIAESVEYGGKHSRIIYKYLADKLIEAALEETAAHDGVERRIRFL